MKDNKVLLASMLAISILSLPVQAASNGQPFRELQTQISINRSLIDTNSAAITDLQENVLAINLRIDDLDTTIDELTTKVDGNTAEIATALAKISSVGDGVIALRAELNSLATQHAADMESMNQALAVIDSKLVLLNDSRKALADELNAKLATLNSQVDGNTLAIDSLVLQLVTVNAQLTGINSSIMDLGDRATQLEAAQAQYASQLAELTQVAHNLDEAVGSLQGYHMYSFTGIKTNLPVASLNGWTQCFQTTYANPNASPESMMSACTGSKIMLACRQTGSDTLTVAAYADRDEVFLNTGDYNSNVHTANGVDWYFSNNWSMGFAPVGEGVFRNSGDVQGMSDNDRLSWHTHESSTNGWRCGSTSWLTSSTSWEKVIYQAD